MIDINFTIYEDPKGKKNSMNIVKVKGKTMIVQNKQYKMFEVKAKKYLPKIETITEPVNIEYTFFRKERRTVDASNLIAAIDDILVKYGILLDDNRDVVAGHDGTRVFHDKDEPRVEVHITSMAEYEQWRKRDG